MIVILCNSFEEAMDAYDMFLSFLEEFEPFSIRKTYRVCYCVETDDDLRYIFTDYRMEKIFDSPDKIDVDRFFEGISEILDLYNCH